MSIKIYVHNTKEDKPATIAEIETLFVNCCVANNGFAELDVRLPNGLAVDSESSDLEVLVIA